MTLNLGGAFWMKYEHQTSDCSRASVFAIAHFFTCEESPLKKPFDFARCTSSLFKSSFMVGKNSRSNQPRKKDSNEASDGGCSPAIAKICVPAPPPGPPQPHIPRVIDSFSITTPEPAPSSVRTFARSSCSCPAVCQFFGMNTAAFSPLAAGDP